MKTKISIKCDITIDLGEVGGYHSKDTLEQIRTAFVRQGLIELRKALEGSQKKITVANPKFTITMSDE